MPSTRAPIKPVGRGTGLLMAHSLTRIWFLLAAALLVGSFAVYELSGFGDPAIDAAFADWYMTAGFMGCGLATLARAARIRRERAPWALLGAGLVLYASGTIYFNVAFGDDPSPPFPSAADVVWLTLYPLAFAAAVLLVRHRFARVPGTVWLDGAIGGCVVAAVAAALLLQPVFSLAVDGGAASVARLAYPMGDLLSLGFIVVVWSLSRRRLSPFWMLLGAGFTLLAVSDSVYVVQASRGDWAPGGLLDVPYVLGTLALAAAAWAAPPAVSAREQPLSTSPLMPVGFALVAVALTAVAVVGGLNPLATGLALVTLVAVVVRLALALSWLTRQRSDLAAQASTDALTGLTNHRAFHERLAQELDRACRQQDPLSVVALDIDHFKAINDTYGHAEGDAALQAVARELASQARPYDVVGRLGGEEFALILPGVEAGDACAVAERCRSAIARVVVHGAPLSCSAGVAAYPADDADGHRLLEFADGALYWAKRSGRAQVRRFDPREVVLLSSTEQHQQVRALLEADGALTPFFQPIVELATGRIAGYEALTRFLATEPVRPPDQWFAQARRCGLGPALEARAIAVALAVPGRPENTFLTLNVSPAGLMSPEVADVLPADLSDLVIELTEDDLFSSDPALDHTLADLRRRGARIAVDDAGAGYAGLQQMVRVKPDILKLDRSLISGIHRDASKIALLESMARFASTTGAAVCAEGIEEADELRLLGRFDVTYGQGYALAPPGRPWPEVDGTATSACYSAWHEALHGLTTEHSSDEARLEHVATTVASVRGPQDIAAALDTVCRDLGAERAALRRLLPDGTLATVGGMPLTSTVRFDETCVEFASAAGRLLVLPIATGGQPHGVLELMAPEGRPWHRSEIHRARVLAQLFATALTGANAIRLAAAEAA
jgi:diguanylate cyclase (GGDEF)-like protein